MRLECVADRIQLGVQRIAAAAMVLVAAPASAIEPETVGQVATLPEIGDHQVWVPDRLLGHSLLFDGDSGEVLGTVDTGITLTPKPPLHARARGEIYSVDIAYSRGRRGERIDVVTIYDAESLAVTGEVVLPLRVAESNASLAHVELLDGDRWLLAFSQFPHAEVAVVDMAARAVAGTVKIAGCAGVYPVDAQRFATLCGDGTTALVTLDAAGVPSAPVHGEAFFDVVTDPVLMSTGRRGTRTWFVSFLGEVHEVDYAGAQPVVASRWSLVDDAAREGGWRPGGLQPVSLHEGSGRLYVAMHEGEPGSHKEAGPEIWVFDVAEQRRVDRFEVPNLTAAFLGGMMGIEGGFGGWLMNQLLPVGGAHSLVVTQDESPVLFARNAELGAVAVIDARSGEALRILGEAGLAGPTLRVPR